MSETKTPFELAVKMHSLGYVVIPGGGGETGKKPSPGHQRKRGVEK